MSILFTFPGQGSQRAGMLHALPDDVAVAATLDETASVLGLDPLTLDTEAALASTRAVQLCLLIAGVAMARSLAVQGGEPDMVAGFSIGEYPAAVVAGALDYADALRLVALRGQLMQQAYPSGYGMAAIVGLEHAPLAALVAQVHSDVHPVYIANLNARRQIVIAGSDHALQQVMALALQHGASKVQRLAVSVPSHCPLFGAQAQEMEAVFAQVSVRRPVLAYLSSSAARSLSDPDRIRDSLASNMARQVNWADTVRLAWERGARLALEMPSGSVLTRLTAPELADGLAISCEGQRSASLLAMLAQAKP
ncbi:MULTISPECIES: malonate decarboxylase subunit epsilon [unclassified Janthinobacterium]|uniref:malonate decarboxylase subunit epsilon n=1 Tax=unclassified Janthinobacterium TaxID=2610881 RepID=UPI001611BACC|nr:MULTISPECIES: malonate decarboxylase subunit epsilon [unclassified Janthinobacterium]MBB5371294.1 malonate decarboxylase epsilon subunit [Janthinobacterium sp. K2C7]MBB5384100.1 malonate decarboxylase epsilon subunit [Janthinobacterium sp. K2Li3]MBB5389440.1 malonate decarboxylase epsilon subunit [Janthinobacterium sp. K2E3]